jgi:flavin-dependent dehydrogenase
MGLFGSLFGSKEKELPPLEPSSAAAQRLGKFKAELEAFVAKMNDTLEFVPADDAVYCFIGKPPAMFGMAWFHDGKEHNLKTLAAAKGLTQKKTQKMSLALGEQYEKFMAEPQYSYTIAGKKVIVRPSDGLRTGVVDVIHNYNIE